MARRGSGLAWIHVAKLAPELRDVLQDHDLATGDGEWIGLDADIVRVYMAALAGDLARRGRFDAVTDQTNATVLAGNWTVNELAAALVGERVTPQRAVVEDAEWRLALCAVELVAPAGLSALSVDDVIRLRTDSNAAFQGFRAKLASLHPVLADRLQGVTDSHHAERIIAEVRDEHMRRDLDNLRDALRDSNVLATTQTMAIQLSVPAGALGAMAMTTSLPLLGLGVAAVVTVSGIAASLLRDRHQAQRGSPATYLFDVEKATRMATRRAAP